MQSLKNASLAVTAVFVAGAGAFAGLTAINAPVGSSAASEAASVASRAATAVSHVAASAATAAAQTGTPAMRVAAPTAAAAVAAVMPKTTAAAAVAAVAPEQALRAQIRWIPTRYGDKDARTLDVPSRLMLAQAAAERAGLEEVGLSFEDVYGVINAETSWIPRTGMGKTGTPSYGLAQFEPGTAKGLGLRDPHDPVQAVYAAAVNMKHGAEWAQDKISHLKLTPEQYSAKIREGVSIYYNLSVRGRNKWDGVNTASLPIETRRHIMNVRRGAERASELAEDLES